MAIYNTVKDDKHTEVVYAGTAVRYTQVLLDKVCHKLGKRLTIFTSKMESVHHETPHATVHDHYENLHLAVEASKDYIGGTSCMVWCDQHIGKMVYRLPKHVKSCWVLYRTGISLPLLLKQNPNVRFNVVTVYRALDPDEEDYPDYDRVRLFTNYKANRTWDDLVNLSFEFGSQNDYLLKN
jgi:hypothetical protein